MVRQTKNRRGGSIVNGVCLLFLGGGGCGGVWSKGVCLVISFFIWLNTIVMGCDQS